jgi:hypothetical protein
VEPCPVEGLRLVLDVLAQCVVVEPIARDARRGTSVHRRGEGKALPHALRLGRLDPCERSGMAAYIDVEALARVHDGAPAAGMPGHRRQRATIASLLDRLGSAPATGSRSR